MKPTCGMCGNPIDGYASYAGPDTNMQSVPLCHGEERDCYHEWTVYGKRPEGFVNMALEGDAGKKVVESLRTLDALRRAIEDVNREDIWERFEALVGRYMPDMDIDQQGSALAMLWEASGIDNAQLKLINQEREEFLERCEQFARHANEIPADQRDRVLTMTDVKVASLFARFPQERGDD